MYSDNHNQSPFNTLPTAVVLLALAIILPEVVFQLAENGLLAGAPIDLRLNMIRQFGFVGQRWMQDLQLSQLPDLFLLVTYPFVSLQLMSTILGLVFVLVFGKVTAEVFGDGATIGIFFATAALGALGYFLLFRYSAILYSAYPPAWGLLGSYSWLQYQAAKRIGAPPLSAFRLFTFLALFDVIFLSTGMSDWSFLADWIAFASGFGLSYIIGPGSAMRLRRWRDRVRQR